MNTILNTKWTILISQFSDSFINNNHLNTLSQSDCLYSLNTSDVEASVSHKYLELKMYTIIHGTGVHW